MSSLPSSGTMLPPAVRYAKIIGTVGSGILAGLYYTHSRHTIPSLLESSVPTEKMVKSFKKIKETTDRPMLYTLLASTSSFAYVSYYLYSNPPDVSVAKTTFSSSSFIPSTTTEYPVGYEWAMYGASTVLLAIVIPYSQIILKKAKSSLLAAAKSVEESEKRKMGVQVVDDGKVKKDLEEWSSRSTFRAGLAGAATVIAVFALAG
ncbi:uncharacterized protein H6S33_011394 [Morchella sextelata]|uniref:uncharacterized protein n=1 Tax=Morchella sextelata TaxID=1174677 RepID=UPI001D036112|nr:uncharacterized protein H6S33_011394 [Morchella sextelata]KAH0610967.1 hypothetical protein H6S33_011394 [Morchella sextelata]